MVLLQKSTLLRGSLPLSRVKINHFHRRSLVDMPKGFLTPHQGVSFCLKYTVDPSNTVKFAEALRKCWESTTKEPECLYFEVFHSPTDAGTFRLVEIWTKDMEWMEKHHLPRDYYQHYRKAVEPLVVTRELEILDRLQNWNVVDDAYLAGSIKTNKRET